MKCVLIALLTLTIYSSTGFGASVVMKQDPSVEKYGMNMVDLLVYSSGLRWQLPRFDTNYNEVKPPIMHEVFDLDFDTARESFNTAQLGFSSFHGIR